MSSLPSLMKKFQTLHRQYIETEAALAEVQKQIVAAGGGSKRRTRHTASTIKHGVAESVRATVKVLRDAGEPLRRQEVADRLGISGSAAGFRLMQALKMQFVEKVNHGRYMCASTVPEL